MWHEALRGRGAENIVDSVYTVVTAEKDVQEFIFWMDNCSSQNKNWVLYTSLVMMVNREEGPKRITLKYLTKGHTHNAADSIHDNIEMKMRKKGKCYDFPDFVDCVANCRKGVSAIELKNFRD